MNIEKRIQEIFSQDMSNCNNSDRAITSDLGMNLHKWCEAKSSNILDMVGIHISLISRELQVLCANSTARNLFGQGMVGKQCFDVYSCPLHTNEELPGCLIKNALFEEHIQEQEVMLTAEDGTEKSFLGKGQVVSRDTNGTPQTIAMIYKETTECTHAKEELEESTLKLKKTLADTVRAMSRTVETRDPYTAGHQQRTMIIAKDIARTMRLTSDQIDGIGMAGAIHDLGKISIPASILSKPGRINQTEFSLIKEHPKTGYNIIKDIDFDTPVAEVVLQHHERLDGSGYPFGLAGDAILMESKVVGVADVIEAIASHRPYRRALGIDTAIDEIKKNKGRLYDPTVVDAAVNLFSGNAHVYHA